MKPQTTKKLFDFIAVIILSFSTIVFYNSCQKEISADTIKTNNTVKANANVSSKIIYTDVIPDTFVSCSIPPNTRGACSSVYYIDLNKDGINDFSIVAFKQIMPTVPILPPKTNSSITATPLNGNASFDTAMYFNNVINGSINWSISSQSLASKNNRYSCNGWNCHWVSTIISGSWSGQTNKYLPLKIVVGTNTYYGWARLNVGSGGTYFTIKDYAYNSTPNQSILAGQTQ